MSLSKDGKIPYSERGAIATPSAPQPFGRTLLNSIAPAIPVFGSIASSLLQRHWANKDLKRQLEYNSLEGQKRQAKEAGLPLAALVSGLNAGKSEGQRATEVAPDLGTAKALESYQMVNRKKQEMQMLSLQMEQQKALTEKTWADALKSNAEAQEANMRKNWLQELSPTTGQTNFTDLIMFDRRKKEAETIASELEKEILSIREGLTKQQIEAQIEHILKSNDRLQQLIDNQDEFVKLKNQIMDDWDKGGTGFAGIGRLLQGMAYKWLFKE